LHKTEIKQSGRKIKIIIDNFQILRGEYEGQFHDIKLKKIEKSIANDAVPTTANDTTI
jgi:hypothetical protein